jgi:hypothetical protein
MKWRRADVKQVVVAAAAGANVIVAGDLTFDDVYYD